MQVPVGAYVRHRRYGVGRVLAWDRGLFPRVRVRFEDGQDRALDVEPSSVPARPTSLAPGDPARSTRGAGEAPPAMGDAVALVDGGALQPESGFANNAERIVFTIGYENRNIDDIIAVLHEHRVGMLVDIRESPVSKRRGFSKKDLAAAVRAAGMEYVLKREWGNPRRREGGVGPRRNLRQSLTKYTEHLAPHIVDAAAFVSRIIDRRPAFLCYEAEPFHCHRSRFTALVLPHCRPRPAVYHLLPPTP